MLGGMEMIGDILGAGESIVIPAGAPHAVRGVTAFKMLLVVVLPA